jgi:mRNA interferase MazF
VTRPIHVAPPDKSGPVLVLAREFVRRTSTTVTVAPITTRIRGLSSEWRWASRNGLAGPSVVSCDNIATVPAAALGQQIGVLLDDQEQALSSAIAAAFDLD